MINIYKICNIKMCELSNQKTFKLVKTRKNCGLELRKNKKNYETFKKLLILSVTEVFERSFVEAYLSLVEETVILNK